MKVLYIIDSFAVGGAETSLLQLITVLPNVESVVCGVYSNSTLKEKFQQTDATVYHLNLPGKYNWRKAYSKLSEIIATEQPQLIHASLYRSSILSRFLGSTYKLPVLNSIVSDSYGAERFASLSFTRSIKLKSTLLIDRLTTPMVSRFISNSQTVKASYSKITKVPADKISVIFRGRNPSHFLSDRKAEVDALKKDFHTQDKFVFLIVGRLIETKGHLPLIEAFNEVQKKHPETMLLIVGDGGFKGKIQEKISNLNLSGKVVLTGSREDIPAFMKLADVFVFPSTLEGLPGVLIEASFSKLPAIVSDIKPNLEIYSSATANIFPVGDTGRLQQLMEDAIKNYQAGQKKATLAFELALQKFDIAAVGKAHVTLYNESLKNK